MARGAEDFGAVAPQTLTGPALDPGELAVRLGSPVAWNRLGRVIYMITGDRMPGAGLADNPGTGRIDRIAGGGLFGGYGIRIRAAASSINEASVSVRLPRITAGIVGLEILWFNGSFIRAAEIRLEAESDAITTTTGLRYNTAVARIQYLDSAGSWVSTPTQPEGQGTIGRWRQLKLVQDADAGTYVRGIFDGVDLGIDGIAGDPTGQTDTDLSIVVASNNVDGAAGNAEIMLGALIVTVDEPS